jgi:hypothetical protein
MITNRLGMQLDAPRTAAMAVLPGEAYFLRTRGLSSNVPLNFAKGGDKRSMCVYVTMCVCVCVCVCCTGKGAAGDTCERGAACFAQMSAL